MNCNLLNIFALFVVFLTATTVGLVQRNSGSQHFMVERWYPESLAAASSEGADEGKAKIKDTNYEDCGSLGELKSVLINSCDGEEEDTCVLKKGENATIKLSFVPKEDSKTLKAIVHGVLGTVAIPFHIPQGDACQNSGITCPIKSTDSISYHTEIPVLKAYPAINVKVKWEIKDSKGKDIICVIIPAKIE